MTSWENRNIIEKGKNQAKVDEITHGEVEKPRLKRIETGERKNKEQEKNDKKGRNAL